MAQHTRYLQTQPPKWDPRWQELLHQAIPHLADLAYGDLPIGDHDLDLAHLLRSLHAAGYRGQRSNVDLNEIADRIERGGPGVIPF